MFFIMKKKIILALALTFLFSFAISFTTVSAATINVGGTVQLMAEDAQFYGDYIELEPGELPNIGRWRPANRPTGEAHGDNYAYWNINVTAPGTYRIAIYYAKNTNTDPINLQVALGDRNQILLTTEVAGADGNWTTYIDFELGTIDLPAGAQTLILAVDQDSVSNWVLNLRHLTLELVSATAGATETAAAPQATPAPPAAPQPTPPAPPSNLIPRANDNMTVSVAIVLGGLLVTALVVRRKLNA